MDKKFDASAWGERFEYEGFHGHKAHCLILREGNVIIATEAPDNDGTSITNMAEDLATVYMRAHGLDASKVTWVEHYPHEGRGEIGESFDLVTFEVGDLSRFGKPGPSLRSPQWTHLGREKAEELFGRPLPE